MTETNVTEPGQAQLARVAEATPEAKAMAIPPAVRRNTVLISVNQALFSGVNQSMVMIAGLSILLIMGSTALAGFASAIVIGGRVLIVYSAGKMMDRIGRKRVLYSGSLLGIIGLSMVVAALSFDSTATLWAGIFVFGIASGMIQLNRVAVMDMYPLSRRGEGMGYYLTGSVVGSIMASD